MTRLAVVALAPTVTPPKVLRRANLADVLVISDIAIQVTPTDPLPLLPDGKRPPLRPVTASPHWRSPQELFTTGNWRKGRSQPTSSAKVRSLAELCCIDVPDKRLLGTQDSAVWYGYMPGTLFSAMVERFKLCTKNEDFVAR